MKVQKYKFRFESEEYIAGIIIASLLSSCVTVVVGMMIMLTLAINTFMSGIVATIFTSLIILYWIFYIYLTWGRRIKLRMVECDEK